MAHYHYAPGSKPAILCVDAEKDLFKVLELFGRGDTFVSWISMAYFNPTASVVINQDRSHPFALKRGTRQGCPLSPLLFALAIEPLAISVRESRAITPISIDGVDHKISLYLMTLTQDPESSIPQLLNLINEFGTVLGFTINRQKSDLLPLTNDLDPTFVTSTQFNISKFSVKYLDVKITKNQSYCLNITSLKN